MLLIYHTRLPVFIGRVAIAYPYYAIISAFFIIFVLDLPAVALADSQIGG